ncbi:hypothetical protein [Roseiflexus castenholzii]|uniref:hypothetical protein n=1 Tax=Roseiflexus castenholzii TaxID=120962 RepID=UPI000315E993|nr:hypothetical protein [Roseiflexus castenholzii]
MTIDDAARGSFRAPRRVIPSAARNLRGVTMPDVHRELVSVVTSDRTCGHPSRSAPIRVP